MDKLTNQQAIEEIKKLKKKLSPHYHLDETILFGSRARGDHLLDSDVDLLLVSGDFPKNFHERIRQVALEWESTVPLEPICYTPPEIVELRERKGIVKQALKEGIRIQ